MKRTLLGLLGALLVACAAAPAMAQAPTEQQATALLEDARRLYDQGQYALAAEKYLQFRDMLIQLGNERAPIALWNAGLAVEHIPGREREALDLFNRFIRDSHSLTDDASVRDMRSEAQTKIANLEASLGLAPGASANQGGGDGVLVPVGATILGIGAAVGLSAIPTGLIALDGRNRIEMECGGTMCTESERALVNEAEAYGIATDVLWVSGLVIAATGATLLGIGLAEESNADTALLPSVGCGPTGCTAALTGRFP